MGLSQDQMDQLGEAAAEMYGDLMETVIYQSRSSASAMPMSMPVSARFRQYSERVIAMAALAGDRPSVERGDQECRLQTARVTWTPTRYDTIQRADGSFWRVQNWRDGEGHPWLKLQVRQVKEEHA